MHHAYLLPDRTETTIDYRPPPVAVLEKAWCTLQTKSLGQLFINYENWWVNYRWRKGPPDASLALDCIAFDSLEQLDLYRYTDLPSHTWNSYNVGRMIFQAICSQCCVASHCCRCHCCCCQAFQHIRTWCQPLSCWARDQLRLPLPIVVLPTLSNCPAATSAWEGTPSCWNQCWQHERWPLPYFHVFPQYPLLWLFSVHPLI